MPARDRQDRGHVGGLAVQVHGQDDLGARGDGRLDQCVINVVRGLVRLDRNWHRTALADRQPSGDVGVRRNDDLVAWTDVHRPQHQMQGVESVRHADGVVGFAELGELGFECFNLGTKNIVAAAKDPLDRLVDSRLEFEVRRLKVEEWHLHDFMPWACMYWS